MSTTIGSNDPYIYNKPDTVSANETKKVGNDSQTNEVKETEKNTHETKIQEPKEKNDIKTLKLGSSEPVSKLLDFGNFSYTRKADNESLEKAKDAPSEKDQMKFIIGQLQQNPQFKLALQELEKGYSGISEALGHMAAHHIPFKVSINNQEGSVGAEFFNRLQKIINP